MAKRKRCKEGHHSFVPEEGKALLDQGQHVCLNCGMKRGKKKGLNTAAGTWTDVYG